MLLSENAPFSSNNQFAIGIEVFIGQPFLENMQFWHLRICFWSCAIQTILQCLAM